MTRTKYLLLPISIGIVAAVYWLVSYETAGAVMLGLFAVAMAVMGWILVPTAGDIGPTAPIDPEFGQPERANPPPSEEPH